MTPPGVGGVSAYFSIQSTRRKSSAAKLEAMRIYRTVTACTSHSHVIENGGYCLSQEIAADSYIAVFSATVDSFPEVPAELL